MQEQSIDTVTKKLANSDSCPSSQMKKLEDQGAPTPKTGGGNEVMCMKGLRTEICGLWLPSQTG